MIDILRAQPDQAEALQHLARASKQYWGYDSSYMQLWHHDKTLTADFIAKHPVYYAALETETAGFYALELSPSICELKHLWIDPGYIGRGIGTQLLGHLIALLRSADAKTCQILAEPHAEGFYSRISIKFYPQWFDF